MIFPSAQPDDKYFIWQLEIQLKNYQSLGIHWKQFSFLNKVVFPITTLISY